MKNIVIILLLPILIVQVSVNQTFHRDEYNKAIGEIVGGINIVMDPSIRERAIIQLGKLKGREAETLRTLALVNEHQEDFLEKLLIQIFSTYNSEDTNLSKSNAKLKRELSSLFLIYDEKQQEARKLLIESVSRNTSRMGNCSHEKIVSKKDKTDLNFITLVNPFYLLEEKQERKEIYSKLVDFYGRSATEFRILLWLAEPDPEIQEYLLIQARKNGEDVRDISYIPKLIKMIQYLSPEQQTMRTKIIEELWKIKIKTLIDVGMKIN